MTDVEEQEPEFLFDNNLSPQLVAGMKAFGERATHVLDLWKEDPGDEKILSDTGRKQRVLVTRDRRMKRRPAEIDAYRRHRVGGFMLTGKNLSHCDLIRQVVRNWARMKELARITPRPFLFRVPPSGTRIDPIPL